MREETWENFPVLPQETWENFPTSPLMRSKCQHSSSLISSIKKRIFVIFERVPLTTPEMNPGPLAPKVSTQPLDLPKLP